MKRILLFDDDYESMAPFKVDLEDRGYAVELTAQAEITERLARKRFDLVCVDIMIHSKSPDATGKLVQNVHFDGINWQRTGQEFLRRLRKGEFSGEVLTGQEQGTSPDVPVMILSATADPSTTGIAQASFEKPFDVDEVMRKIDELVSKTVGQWDSGTVRQ